MADINSVGEFGKDVPNSSSNTTNPTILMDPCELDKMVAESLKDVSSDDDDDNLESDDELMRQLKEITEGTLVTNDEQKDRILSKSAQITVDFLKHRIEMYKLAEANEKTAGKSAKVRRLSRGLAKLNDLLRQTNDGEQILTEDIPPEVTSKSVEGNAAATADEQSPDSKQTAAERA